MVLNACRVILIGTATAAIDVTTVFVVIIRITDSTTLNGHLGIMIGMAVLTAAIDRTPNPWT